MSLEYRRRGFLQVLNSRWIAGCMPLLHTIVLLFQMAAISLLIQRFNAYYIHRPILTTMITNAILGGIADTVAQAITSVRLRNIRKNSDHSRNGLISVEIHELDKKPAWPSGEVMAAAISPPPFDFERSTRFMSYGFLIAPIQFHWYGFLSRSLSVAKHGGMGSALKRVAFDQLIFSPCSLALFFAFMTIAEGGGRRAIGKKLQEVYLPALKANYMLWPAVQLLNFRLMPLPFQIPFVSTIGIAWTVYLSLTNASDEA